MKIGIDLDEVLAELMPELIDFYNESQNTSFKIEEFHFFNLEKVWGGTREEAIKKVHEFYKSPSFDKIKPIIGCKEVLDILKKENELFIITSRPKNLEFSTKQWLEKYFPNTFSGVFFTNQFSLSEEKTTKLEICNSLGIEVFIDDHIDYALECLSSNRKVFLFNKPWNQKFEIPESIQRVSNWNEILSGLNS